MLFSAATTLPDASSPEAVGWVILILLTLLNGAVAVKQLITRKPPLHKEYVSRTEHQALARKVDELDDKIEAGFASMADKSSTGREKIYNLLRKQGEDIAALRQASDTASAQVGQLSYKLDQILLNKRS